jgi:NAD(P)-dependent dehydrogenase (short-subunit alcohol dehydrogenase family)
MSLSKKHIFYLLSFSIRKYLVATRKLAIDTVSLSYVNLFLTPPVTLLHPPEIYSAVYTSILVSFIFHLIIFFLHPPEIYSAVYLKSTAQYTSTNIFNVNVVKNMYTSSKGVRELRRVKLLARHLTRKNSTSNRRPVCLVLGAGRGIGGHVAKKFATEGYHAVLCRRSNQMELQNSVNDILSNGGQASGYLLNAILKDSIENLVEKVESNIGPIQCAVYNLGSQIGTVPIMKTSHKQFEMGWQLGTFGLFRLAQSLLPHMLKRKNGSILVTSSTASVRGNAGQHSHAASMGGRRMLCQTLNAEYASKNIHVAHIIVDGAVDAPDTLGKMLGKELFQKMKNTNVDGFIAPSSVADTFWHLHNQHRSARTFEIDIRSFNDVAWFNSKVTTDQKF